MCKKGILSTVLFILRMYKVLGSVTTVLVIFNAIVFAVSICARVNEQDMMKEQYEKLPEFPQVVYGTLPFRYFALQVRCPSELCPSGTLPFTKYEG